MNNIKSYKLKNKLITYPKHDILYNYYLRYKGGLSSINNQKSIPNLVYAIFEFYNTESLKKGGLSEDIARYIHGQYKEYNNNLGIRNITNSNLQFTILHSDNYEKYEPVMGMGTYTAVYNIDDINNNINDNKDNIYILRIYDRQYSIHMFDSPKVKNEYALFSQYMSKIYYYGEVQQENSETYDYTITKKYNTPVIDGFDILNLTNLQKFKFLLNNLDMLNTLQEQKYIHLDYKINNIAWEDPNTMNVILIDYDHNTLFKIDGDDDLFVYNADTNNYIIKYTTTFIPEYIAEYISEYNNDFVMPPSRLDKYSMGGFFNLYQILNIEFVSESIDNIDPPIEINDYVKITQIDPAILLSRLEIDSYNYEIIPTYAELLNFFLNLGISGFIKDVKKEDLL
jgi:hypothetical protein